MLDKFPCIQNQLKLRVADFTLFSESYGKILEKKIPVSCGIFLFSDSKAFLNSFSTERDQQALGKIFQEIQNGELFYGVHSDIILLPFMVEDGCVIAVITDTDPVFQQKVDSAWLAEIAEAAKREFILLKEARVDMQTGLLNLSNLYSLLENSTSDESLSLVLIELIPKRFSYQHIQRYITNSTTLLRNFLKNTSGLHYLGNCTFGLVLNEYRNYGKTEVERSLAAYLRREGCHRVAIGSSSSNSTDRLEEGSGLRILLDEAWTAICHAKKLGPFSFSNYQILKHPENHSLALPDRNLVRKLSRLWAGVDTFFLIQFKIENSGGDSSILLSLLDRGEAIVYGESVYLFIKSGDTEEVLKWLVNVINLGGQKTSGARILAGVGLYPHIDFTKSEVVSNCKKALLHASYYDDSNVVLFDAISLNISGDVFFSDGNLTKAAREYRRGLKCNYRDVNLHNSLGVTLAQMDKLNAANASFQAALGFDSQNFMSFYNLGLLEQKRNNQTAALKYFKQALRYYSNEEYGQEYLQDLELQLGILSCEDEDYQAAIDYLKKWFERNEKESSFGHIYYFLGKACFGLENNKKAMEYLQKALQFDEFDARSMSLLGYIYAKEKQGDEIALSLCLKSLELEPDNVLYKLQLATVYLMIGRYQEAKENVLRCLRSKKTKVQAQFIMGEIYAFLGKTKRAKAWFEKVKSQGNGNQTIYDEAEKRLQD